MNRLAPSRPAALGAGLLIGLLLACLAASPAVAGQGAEGSPFGVAASPEKDRAFGRDPEKAVARLKELGVKWVRIHWAWKKIEPAKGVIDKAELARHDAVIERLGKEGINVVLLVGGVPGWSADKPAAEKARPRRRKQGHVPTEEHLKEVVSFVVARYKGKVAYYQILNETTLPAHWTEPEQFARQLAAAYQAAKAKDGACKVIMGGFGAEGKIPKTEYLERFLKAGGGQYVDVFDFHMYNYISRLYKDIPALREVLRKHSVNKPIWVLETGEPSYFDNPKAIQRSRRRYRYQAEGAWDWPGTFDEEVQTRRLVERMTLALSQGVERIFWYSLQDRLPREKVDPKKKRSGHKNTKGLLYADFTPKKAFYAYKFLMTQLAGATYTGSPELGDKTRKCFLFQRGKETVGVLWCWEGTAKVKLKLGSATQASVYDKLGAAAKTLKANEKGEFELDLSPDPIYVIAPQAPEKTPDGKK